MKTKNEICECGHNKLYHDKECVGMLCNCKKFKPQKPKAKTKPTFII